MAWIINLGAHCHRIVNSAELKVSKNSFLPNGLYYCHIHKHPKLRNLNRLSSEIPL